MTAQARVHRLGRPDQQNANAQFARGAQRAFDFAGWGVIAAHGVNGNSEHGEPSRRRSEKEDGKSSTLSGKL
jgi:hypothetical protein